MLYVQDRMNHTLAVLENYYNDTHTLILESGVSTYNFTIPKNQDGSEYLVRGNYVVLADDKGQGWKFTIMATDETHSSLDVECEDLGLELLNKVRNSWASPGSAQPFKYYFDKAVRDTGWTLGVNEISNLNRTLSWDGRDTALKRLLSICTQFDHAEIEFKVEFKNMQVTKQVINVYKQRGANRSDVQLVYGDTVNDIRKTTEIRELATAIQGVGGVIQKDNPVEGEPEEHVDFASLTYDDGEYFTPAGGPFVYARVANQQFNIKDTYLEDFYDYDTQDAQELLNRTLTQLKERCQPKVNYEVDLAKVDSSLNFGDTVTIIDHDYKPELLLSGRVLQIEKSYTDSSKNKATFGNFLILYSNISDQLRALQEQMNSLKPVANYMWLRYAEDDKGTGMTAAPNIRTTHVAFLSNQKTGVPSDDPADYAGHWVLIKGPKGDTGDKGTDGEDGVAGKDGVGVKTTTIAYAQSTNGTTPPTASWTDGVPTLIKGQYLWTRTVWVYTDSSTETGYTVSYNAKDGNTGADGRAGKDGVGISSTVIEYVGAVSGTSAPVSGWSTTIPAVPAGQYLWTRTTWKYTDGTSEQGFTNALMGRTGASGKDGVAGKDGNGIKSTVVTYQASSNGTTAPTGAWTANVPSTAKGQYLWTRTIWTYTDNTSETSYSVAYIAKDGNSGKDGIAGKDGVGIKSTTITYATSTSGTVTPGAGWVANPPAVSPGQFMWTKTVWSYTDNSSETGYSVAQAGKTGATGPAGKDGIAGKDGVGIKSTTITYQASTSGTTAPTGAWVASPTAVAGQYQWTRTVWAYTDGTTEVGYSVGHIGANGATGKDGVAGKDGVGIKTTAITYATSTSGTSAPASGWVSAPPSAAAGQFIWTRTIWTYTDNTTETGYSVGKIGEKGDKGDTGQGIPGKPGADGRTQYLHTAWANSFDGKDGFSTDVSTNKSYMGTYANFTEADPTDPTKYSWVELVGNLQVGGRNYLLDTSTSWQAKGSGGTNQSSSRKWLFTFGTIKQAPFRDGDYVTVSFDYINVGSGAYGTILPQFNNTPWGPFNGGEPMKDNGHFVRTIPWKSGWTDGGTATGIQIRIDNVATTRTVTVYNMQFERGNKATDHKVAPEDTQGKIDKVNNGLADTNSKIAAVTKVDSQATAPTNPKKGDQWWVKDANGNINAFKIWDGTKWADSIIQQSAMNIGTLNGNIINGATINGSEFTNSFDYTGPDNIHYKGVTQIKDGAVNITWKIPENNQTGNTSLNASGLESIVRDTEGTIIRSARLQMGELQLGDGKVSGWLNEQDVYQNYTNQVQYLDGWSGWNNPISITRRGKMVTFSGYIAHNGGSAHINIAQFPAWARPEHTEFIVEIHFGGDTGTRTNGYGNLMLSTSGRLIINRGLDTGQHTSFGYTFVGQDI